VLGWLGRSQTRFRFTERSMALRPMRNWAADESMRRGSGGEWFDLAGAARALAGRKIEAAEAEALFAGGLLLTEADFSLVIETVGVSADSVNPLTGAKTNDSVIAAIHAAARVAFGRSMMARPADTLVGQPSNSKAFRVPRHVIRTVPWCYVRDI
jgi:hypothetical protein